LGLLGEMQHFIARLSRTTQDGTLSRADSSKMWLPQKSSAMQQWKMNTDPQWRHVE